MGNPLLCSGRDPWLGYCRYSKIGPKQLTLRSPFSSPESNHEGSQEPSARRHEVQRHHRPPGRGKTHTKVWYAETTGHARERTGRDRKKGVHFGNGPSRRHLPFCRSSRDISTACVRVTRNESRIQRRAISGTAAPYIRPTAAAQGRSLERDQLLCGPDHRLATLPCVHRNGLPWCVFIFQEANRSARVPFGTSPSSCVDRAPGARTDDGRETQKGWDVPDYQTTAHT